MSAPVSPTFVKRKAKRAVSARTRKSEASASTAPAPAAIPLIDATTGFEQPQVADHGARHARELRACP